MDRPLNQRFLSVLHQCPCNNCALWRRQLSDDCWDSHLVAVAMHIALASPTSGHFVACSNQSPNCFIGSNETSWSSSKHCEVKVKGRKYYTVTMPYIHSQDTTIMRCIKDYVEKKKLTSLFCRAYPQQCTFADVTALHAISDECHYE